MILAFDTSNYTTSACLFDPKRGVVWENRILLHPPKGQRGLRQSDVVFQHTLNMEHILDGFPQETPNAVVASEKPCPQNGSYMPCFLVGKHFASAMSAVLHCPCAFFSHQENHIMAGLYSSGGLELLQNDFLAFHISGGTTDLLHIHPTDAGLQIKRIGGSADLHAGQLIDRVGVMLGMQFPCGKELETLAARSARSFSVKTGLNDLFFHLSGFENQASALLEQSEDGADVAKFVLDCIFTCVHCTLLEARKIYEDLPVLFVGGVMSNRYIASRLQKCHDRLIFSDPKYSSDHALGNAVLYHILRKR